MFRRVNGQGAQMIGNILIQNLAKPFQHQVNTYGALTKFLATVKAAAPLLEEPEYPSKAT